MPVSPLWSILFFFMLVTLGLDSEFAMLETVTTAMIDAFPKLRRFKTFVIAGMCFALFLLGLPFCTQGGIYIFQIINDYSAGYCVVILALTECIAVAYIYGIRRFLKDVAMMLGSTDFYATTRWSSRWVNVWVTRIRRPFHVISKYYWIVTLAGMTPAYLVFVLVASLIWMEPSTYGTYVLPPSAQGLGLALSLAGLVFIPVFAIYHLVKCCKEKKPIKSIFMATPDWCPTEERAKKRPTVAVANTDIFTLTTTKL